MILFFVLLFLIASLTLLFMAVVAAVKGVSPRMGRVLAAAMIVETCLVAGYWKIKNDVQDVWDNGTVSTFMEVVEDGIRSGHAAETAAILHTETHRLEKSPEQDWRLPVDDATSQLERIGGNANGKD
jgi:hypothetical protein